jgi:hypothetical protein
MTLIYPCPDCGQDLECDDGFGLWCQTCEHYHPFEQFDDPDDEHDRRNDERGDAA